MANMAKQMELFEPITRGFQEGGLKDEGGKTDPVSGNEVPPGSLRKEVRDDIPAQLSEGEFVFPADVVRYIGLETLMRMRQEAKMGLAQMEAMGQMGNSEEATMPDDLPFDMYDLEVEDDGLEMNQGGVVYAANGAFATPTPMSTAMGATTTGGSYNPATNQFQPFAGMGSTQPQPLGTAFAAPTAASSAYNPRLGGTLFTPTTPEVQYQQPTLYGTTGFGPEGVEFEDVTYTNEQGQTLKLKRNKQTGQLFDLSGNPAVVPEGYTEEVKEEEQVETAPTTDTRVKTAKVVDDGGKDDPVNQENSIRVGGRVADPAKGERPGTIVGGTMMGVTVLDMPGSIPGPLGTVATALQNIGKPVPANATMGIVTQGIITPMSGTAYNNYKEGKFMSPELVRATQRNVAIANTMRSKYGAPVMTSGGAKTVRQVADEVSRTDPAIVELAEAFDIRPDSIKSSIFGKSYNDALDKALEAAKEDPGLVSQFFSVDEKGTLVTGKEGSKRPVTRKDMDRVHKATIYGGAIADSIGDDATGGYEDISRFADIRSDLNDAIRSGDADAFGKAFGDFAGSEEDNEPSGGSEMSESKGDDGSYDGGLGFGP